MVISGSIHPGSIGRTCTKGFNCELHIMLIATALPNREGREKRKLISISRYMCFRHRTFLYTCIHVFFKTFSRRSFRFENILSPLEREYIAHMSKYQHLKLLADNILLCFCFFFQNEILTESNLWHIIYPSHGHNLVIINSKFLTVTNEVNHMFVDQAKRDLR